MRRLLVPLDGTPFAEAALPLARRIAQRAGAELLLVHGFEPTRPIAPAGEAGLIELPAAPDTVHALRRARQDYLDDAVARTRLALRPAVADRRLGQPPPGAGDPAAAEVPVRGMLVEGSGAATLRDAALDAAPDLVVMATHAEGGPARLLFGSVTETMVRAGGLPVLAVPPAATAGDPHLAAVADPALAEGPLPRHVLVALDGSPEAEAILAPALALAGLLDAAVTLATVRDGGDGDDGTDAAGYLDAVARRLAADEARVTTRVLAGHPVADALVAGAAALGADLLALVTHGRGFWARLLEGSVAQDVLARGGRPVLLLRP